jgi:hypothetical protein
MKIINKIDGMDANEVKAAFKELLADYLTPAFGSISKRDFDILLFMKLQELGVIDNNPEIYELVSDLKVTRAKARNLLYEAKLRVSSEEDLDEELKQLLINPIFLKENDKIGIEVENPYLTDHLRFKLKKLNHITDGSFSPELVKLTTEAYLALFKSYLPDKSEKKIIKAFVEVGAKKDTSFTGIMTAVLGKLGSKVADEAGSELAKSLGKYLGPILTGSTESIKELFSEFFEDEGE